MNLDKIIGIIKSLKEEAPTMSLGAGQIAGTVEAGDDPPVSKKKKKKKKYSDLPTIIGRGKFPGARARWSKGV